uniref:Calnexin 14D n=1 Tax=Drosophila melanogaster TaxID=7227 RepID=Q9VXF6_DROME|nr:calnexin 14D [Drosophila melanogaster]AAF48618.2 calnexin 14D [Drosophila melanogaster]|eukprot:NP_573131.1 calnexin 14D [Drosophila melanogaster]
MAWKMLFAILLLLSAAKTGYLAPESENSVEDVQIEPGAIYGDEKFAYKSPVIDAEKFYFADHFDDVEASRKRWVLSQAKKNDIADEIAKYDGIWNWESPQRIFWANDLGLVLKSKAKHAAIAAPFRQPFDFKSNKPLVVQYELTLQEGQDCGGSYLKLLSAGKGTEQLNRFNDKTPYTIMFGPDKCGNNLKMHFIFRHVNPLNGNITEKHCKKPNARLGVPFTDKLPHLYQLVVRPDNSFEIRLDHKIIKEGSLLTDFVPPVNPPAEIDDPNDHKPESWDERKKIPDPNAHKPEDWDEDAPPHLPDTDAVMPNGWLEDEPDMIFDPTAIEPEDWNSEIDGEWEAPLVENPVCKKAPGCGKWKAPLIPNPNYKGKWSAPMIENPNNQGKWAPRKIANPDFFEDLKPFQMTPINAVGLELWSMSSDILFDNLIITDDVELARDFAANSFDIKRLYIDRESFGNKVVELARANRAIWGIVIVAIAVPVAITIFCKFGLGPSRVAAAKKAAAAAAKKTDDPQPDDDLGAEEEEKLEKGKKEEEKKEEEEEEEKEENKEEKKEEEKDDEKEMKDCEEEEDDEEKDDEEKTDERAAGDTNKESTPLSASPKKNQKSYLDNNEDEEDTLKNKEPTPKKRKRKALKE